MNEEFEEFEEFDTETVVNIARACMNDAIDYFWTIFYEEVGEASQAVESSWGTFTVGDKEYVI